MIDFLDCLHSLAPDNLHRTSSPCLRVLTWLSFRELLPPCIHSPTLPQDNNRDLGALSYTSDCRHFPIARCTFSPFNKISATVASLFFLCKDSPARALQVPVVAPYLCTKFQHAFRIFFFTPCLPVAKQNVVFQNFPCYSLHFALSLSQDIVTTRHSSNKFGSALTAPISPLSAPICT